MADIIYLTCLSLACLVMGLVLSWKRVALFLKGRRTTGQFVRWELGGLKGQYFHPVVAFVAEDGKRYEFVGMPGSSRKWKQASFTVLYPAGDPDKAMIHSLLGYWAAPLAFFMFAAVAVVAAWQQR